MPVKKKAATKAKRNDPTSKKIFKRQYVRKVTIAAPKPTTLELFLDLIASIYPEDKLTPGVVLSHIGHGAHAGEWYGAAYRYPGERNQFNYLKRVRIGLPAFGPSIEEVVIKLAAPWTSQDIAPLRDELRKRSAQYSRPISTRSLEPEYDNCGRSPNNPYYGQD